MVAVGGRYWRAETSEQERGKDQDPTGPHAHINVRANAQLRRCMHADHDLRPCCFDRNPAAFDLGSDHENEVDGVTWENIIRLRIETMAGKPVTVRTRRAPLARPARLGCRRT